MIGLILKSVRETWVITAIMGAAMLALEVALHVILPQFQTQADDLFLQVPFIRTVISALMGADVGESFTTTLLQAILWLHPVVLTVAWAHAIILCTRIPAGEIERGTIDVLLAQPLSRRAVYAGDSLVCLASGLAVLLGAFLGTRIGAAIWTPDDGALVSTVLLILLNFAALYVAVAGLASLVSALTSRRGKAMGIAFAIVVGSFLLNFLAQAWEPARAVSFLGVLEYYRPADVLRTGRAPVGDVVTLLAIGAASWIAGCVVFQRRDIATA